MKIRVYLFYILLLFVALSCVKDKENTNNSVASSKENTIKNNVVNQKAVKLPFSFADFIFDSLTAESRYNDLLFKTLNKEYNSEHPLIKKVKTITISEVDKFSQTYYPHYYSILLNDNVIISPPTVFMELPIISEHIYAILTLSKISNKKYNRVSGAIVEIITYSEEFSILDRKLVMVAGLGNNDDFYYECFRINKDEEISIKSYLRLEDEFNTVSRTLKIEQNGKITTFKADVTIKDIEVILSEPDLN